MYVVSFEMDNYLTFVCNYKSSKPISIFSQGRSIFFNNIFT